MVVKSPEPLEVLRERIEQRDWQGAIELLSQLKAADEAATFSELSERNKEELLPRLNSKELAKILEGSEKAEVARISRKLSPSTLSEVLDQVSPEHAADVLHQLPPSQAQEVLGGMKAREAVSYLINCPDESAGGLMTPELVTFNPEMTVAEALSRLREVRPARETVNVFFVVDHQGKLCGQLSLRGLILADPQARIGEVMQTDVLSVTPETDREQCARLMERYNLTALPVVDQEQRLLGLIRLEESIRVLEDENTEDMYHMIGLSGQERASAPWFQSVKRRLPWLCLNLGTAILAGLVVSLFESTVAKAAILAAFIPIVAGQGANAGAQTLTIIVRSLALGEVSFRNARKVLFKEVSLAFVSGLVVALIASLIALLWKGNPWLALVLGVAMLFTMLAAGLSGALVPLILKLLRVDPALASSIIVTTITDVLSALFLLSLATAVLHFL